MANVIPKWLVEQYQRAKTNGWLPYFREGAGKYGFRVEDLLGLASRESNLKNIKGDFHDGTYHGFSLMQLDINSHRAWIESGEWERDVRAAVLKGCAALAEKREQIIKASKQKSAFIKFRSGKVAHFVPKPFTDDELRQITIASYNCGIAAYYHFSLGHRIDAGTANKNYSNDVLSRSEDFRDLMARDAFGKTANDRVIEPTPGETGNQVVRPEPIPQAKQSEFPFGTFEEKYERHADLIKSERSKTIARRIGVRLLSGLGAIWGTTGGRFALLLSTSLVIGLGAYYGYKYRYQIAVFFKQFGAYVRGKF